MMSLNLEALFSPEMLQAYRASWGVDETAANRLAAKIIGMFENPTSAKQEWLRDVVLALVGEEPDLNSWVAAFGRGSFDIRPEATYGRAKDKGSPARVIKRQRVLIDRLIDKTLPPAERELRKLTYQDALRLIVASMVVRELKTGVAAKAAIGTGWPVMVIVNDHLLAAEKRKLQRFGGNPSFRMEMAKAISHALESWIASTPDDDEPCGGDAPLHANELPPGVSVDAALTYLGHEANMLQQYRAALFGECGIEAKTGKFVEDAASIRSLAKADMETIHATY